MTPTMDELKQLCKDNERLAKNGPRWLISGDTITMSYEEAHLMTKSAAALPVLLAEVERLENIVKQMSDGHHLNILNDKIAAAFGAGDNEAARRLCKERSDFEREEVR